MRTHLAVLSHTADQLCTHFQTRAYCSLHIMHKCSLCLLIDSFTPLCVNANRHDTHRGCTHAHGSRFNGYFLVAEHRPCFTPCSHWPHRSQLRIEGSYLATSCPATHSILSSASPQVAPPPFYLLHRMSSAPSLRCPPSCPTFLLLSFINFTLFPALFLSSLPQLSHLHLNPPPLHPHPCPLCNGQSKRVSKRPRSPSEHPQSSVPRGHSLITQTHSHPLTPLLSLSHSLLPAPHPPPSSFSLFAHLFPPLCYSSPQQLRLFPSSLFSTHPFPSPFTSSFHVPSILSIYWGHAVFMV